MGSYTYYLPVSLLCTFLLSTGRKLLWLTRWRGGRDFTRNTYIYVLLVDLHAACKFTGHWPPHRPHTAVSSVNCVGISRKLKSTCQDQNNASTSFLSIVYDNLCQYQPMMSPVAVNIGRSDFFLPLVKGVTGFIAAIHRWRGGSEFTCNT